MIAARNRDRSLRKLSALLSIQIGQAIPCLEAVEVLNNAKIRYVLTGCYGLARWLEDIRAGAEIEVVVAADRFDTAICALLSTFPQLRIEMGPLAVRFYDQEFGDLLIRMAKPAQEPMVAVMQENTAIGIKGKRLFIPTVEMALVLKFSGLVCLYRPEYEKYQEAHDFARILMKNQDIDEKRAALIAERMYRNAGSDLLNSIRRMRNTAKSVI